MPYRVRRRSCRMSDGRSGTHVVEVQRPGGRWERASCHQGEASARAAIRAREGAENVKLAAHNFKLAANYEVRRTTYRGRPHLVVPAVMLVEGVHCGILSEDGGQPRQACLYYPAQEIEATAEAWNGYPVVVNHPQGEDGRLMSAMSSGVVRVGHIANARMLDAARLGADLWLDEARLRAESPETLVRIERGDAVELSTGLDFQAAGRAGTWHNEQYERSVKNIQPDHLALLPHDEGACSGRDGCGVGRNRKEIAVKKGTRKLALAALGLSPKCVYAAKSGLMHSNMLTNEAFMEERLQAVRTAVDALDSPSWWHLQLATTDNEVVYKMVAREDGPAARANEPSQILRQEYTFDEEAGKAELVDGTAVRVREKREFVPVAGEAGNQEAGNDRREQEGTEMTEKQKKVAALIANASLPKLTEADRPWLEKLDDAQLDALAPTANQEPDPEEEETATTEEPEAEEKPEEKAAPTPDAGEGDGEDKAENKGVTLADIRRLFKKEVPAMVNSAVDEAINADEKARLVAALAKNEACPYDEAKLSAMPYAELVGLAKMANVKSPDLRQFNRIGQLGGALSTGTGEGAPKSPSALRIPTGDNGGASD